MKEKKICRQKNKNGKSIESGSEGKEEKKSSHGSDPTGKIYSGT